MELWEKIAQLTEVNEKAFNESATCEESNRDKVETEFVTETIEFLLTVKSSSELIAIINKSK